MATALMVFVAIWGAGWLVVLSTLRSSNQGYRLSNFTGSELIRIQSVLRDCARRNVPFPVWRSGRSMQAATESLLLDRQRWMACLPPDVALQSIGPIETTRAGGSCSANFNLYLVPRPVA